MESRTISQNRDFEPGFARELAPDALRFFEEKMAGFSGSGLKFGKRIPSPIQKHSPETMKNSFETIYCRGTVEGVSQI